MRRLDFLKMLAVLGAAASAPAIARVPIQLKMMIPANPGGGWDATGRALAQAMQHEKLVDAVQYDYKGGAAGMVGLAQFANTGKGESNALMVMGSVMLGGSITGKMPLVLDKLTPIARLASEYNVFAVPAASPILTMADLVAQLKRNPASVKWGGGSRGATEHICASLLATQAGVDPKKINYVAFRGGGEATAAVLGGSVTVGGSGYSEFSEYIAADRMRAIGVTSEQRLPGLMGVPTLKEMGFDVVLGNWRGVYGAPDLTTLQRDGLIDLVQKATRSKVWLDALEKNAWTPAWLPGGAFEAFVASELASLRAIMHKAGMV